MKLYKGYGVLPGGELEGWAGAQAWTIGGALPGR